MNNIASPTVAQPIFNGLQMPTIEIPKVPCVADASRYPSKPNTEDVLLDTNDPDIAYFRKTDSNGFVQVDRRRCIPEPEPTQQDLNDARYLSREEFSNFMNEFRSFREEMSNNVRVLATANNAASNNSGNSKHWNGGNKRNDSANTAVQNTNSGNQPV